MTQTDMRATGASRVRRPAPHGATGATSAMLSDWRSFQRTVRTAMVIFLALACIARLTGWRWRPWPPGPDGYGSVIHEAREASENDVAMSFMAW